jgi:hypothetical protein
MGRGVVISVVKVAFFGKGNLSSSPHAGATESGTVFGPREEKIVIKDRTTIRLIHRDFIA